MTIEWVSIPLAATAGVLGVLSPCVWPLVPVVLSTVSGDGRWRGPAGLILGLSAAFAFAGSLVSFALVRAGLDPELFRWAAATLLLGLGVVLVVPALAGWLAQRGSRLLSGIPLPSGEAQSAGRAFGIGFLLGFVWLPCVGPTLGAAIGLASVGQSIGPAFLVMLAYGLGTGAALLVAAVASRQLLTQLRPGLQIGARRGRQLLGATLATLGAMVLSGGDKLLETWAVGWIPDWVVSL